MESGDILASSPYFKGLLEGSEMDLRLRLELGYVLVRVRVRYSAVMVRVWVR